MTTFTQPRQFGHRDTEYSPNGLPAVLRRFANSWGAHRAAGSARRASAVADRQLWSAALADPRIMAEIQRARSQHAG